MQITPREPISVRFHPAEQRVIEAAAHQLRTTRSELIRRAALQQAEDALKIVETVSASVSTTS